MTAKRFFAPFLTAVLLLSAAWFSGADSVVLAQQSDDRTNLQKYVYAQRLVLQNYVNEVEIDDLYKNSIRGLILDVSDSTLKVSGTPLDTTNFSSPIVGDIRESYQNFERAYFYLKNLGSDEDMTERTEDAIRYMMSDLDPHSIYIEPKRNERIQEEFAGKFQGIGVQFDIINDTITVVTPLSGGPSEQVGIQSGDKIVTIDDTLAVGFNNEDVVEHLRGPKDSKVDVGIKRGSQFLNFTITRDDIPLYTVDASYMLDDETGYIKINRFARTTHEEFMTAMKELKSDGMDRLVLDLRNNPGGFMDQALQIADEFIPSSMDLLSTKGRKSQFNQSYQASSEDEFVGKPLIILINEGSASASEIVSGAVQDHDLGLIVGRRSFGKGLVQQQYELPDQSSIRVTISKYYTPSGRLIQKPYKEGREEYAYELIQREDNAASDASEFINNVPDSLTFTTDAGRTVYGGGGIVPDHIIQDDTTTSAVLGFMRRNRLDLEYVVNFMDKESENPKHVKEIAKLESMEFDTFLNTYQVPDEHLVDFRSLMNDKGYVEADSVQKVRYTGDSLYAPAGTFQKDKWIVKGFIKAYIARHIWGQENFYPVYNDEFDTTLKKAMDLWDEVAALEAYRKKQVSNLE